MSAAILAAFLLVGPSSGFTMDGHGAKIIFFHVPCAWLASLCYVFAAFCSVRYLMQARQVGPQAADTDRKIAAYMELGMVFAVLATVTGSIFSHNEWGAYWSWDPRQTSIVIILLLFAAYLVLRGAIEDHRRRAQLGAVYTLVAVIPSVFLIWVLPRIVETLHGNANMAFGQMTGMFKPVLRFIVLPAFLGLFAWVWQLRVRCMRLEDSVHASLVSGVSNERTSL